ncbi:hypothetical protein NM208_g13525 [Fusarium decemcellulare]|uniref:Uncharacterized protein n=1 Tax=Fusarium decemcellulare TaxID=57161 RepID=A0ACC1RKQ6_9HYPO|nr:hypothetical protein NM208_g13525 [Fusarium decemcellulare]
MTTHSVTDSLHIRPEYPKYDVFAREHDWSNWIRVKGGYMRRRRGIPNPNDHCADWTRDGARSQRIRPNPIAHGMQIETANEEFQFKRRVWKQKRMVRRPIRLDMEELQTDEESDICFALETLKTQSDRRDDQDSTIVYKFDGTAVSHPEDMDQREVDLERGVAEAGHDGESVVVPSDHDPMHSNVTSDLQKIDQKTGALAKRQTRLLRGSLAQQQLGWLE